MPKLTKRCIRNEIQTNPNNRKATLIKTICKLHIIYISEILTDRQYFDRLLPIMCSAPKEKDNYAEKEGLFFV